MGQLCVKDCRNPVSLKTTLIESSLHRNLVREQERDFRDVYDVVKLIGEGSISNIYKIRKKESAIGGSSRLSDSSISTHMSEATNPGYTIFALKEIDTSFLKEGCGEVLKNEIELLKELDHPNIIKVHAIGDKIAIYQQVFRWCHTSVFSVSVVIFRLTRRFISRRNFRLSWRFVRVAICTQGIREFIHPFEAVRILLCCLNSTLLLRALGTQRSRPHESSNRSWAR